MGILAGYVGMVIDHCMDPYSRTSIMESKSVFFMAHLCT